LEGSDSSLFAMADTAQQLVYFKSLPTVQGTHNVNLSNAVFCEYVSYNSSVATRKGAAYQRATANLGNANAAPLNIPSYLNGENRTYHLDLFNGALTWRWQGKVIVSAHSLLAIGATIVDSAGYGNPTFALSAGGDLLKLNSFSGAPAAAGIGVSQEVFTD
jgi:hypothetical protein